MRALATTSVDVHRDADSGDSDGYGDETETPDPAGPEYEGIPFSIIEKTSRIPDPTSGNFVPVSGFFGRSGAEHEIRQGDRIHDPAGAADDEGDWYAVASVSHPQNPAMTLDRRYELRKV